MGICEYCGATTEILELENGQMLIFCKKCKHGQKIDFQDPPGYNQNGSLE